MIFKEIGLLKTRRFRQPIPSLPPRQERRGYTETVLDDQVRRDMHCLRLKTICIDLRHLQELSRGPVTLRALDSKVSARVPKGFITLSAEPASAVGEFDPERGKGQGVTDDLGKFHNLRGYPASIGRTFAYEQGHP